MRSEQLDLRKLKAFQLVARLGSLRVAATRLHLTIPAVSFQIKRLESELGIQLFRRLPAGLTLTDAGQDFILEVDSIFGRVETALNSLPSRAQLSGQISIAMSSDVVWFFTPRISNFLKHYPRLRLHSRILHSKEIIVRVLRQELDVGIGYFTRPDKSLQQEIIAETKLSLVCLPDHPLLQRRPIRLDDIAKHRLLLPPKPFETRKIIDRVFSSAGIKPPDIIEAGNCETAHGFAERGAGAAIVHATCVKHQRSDRLRYIDLGRQFPSIEFSAIYRKDAPFTAALRGFLDAIMDKETS